MADDDNQAGALDRVASEINALRDEELETQQGMLKGALDAITALSGLVSRQRKMHKGGDDDDEYDYDDDDDDQDSMMEKGRKGDKATTAPGDHTKDYDDETDDDDSPDPGYQDMDMAEEYLDVTDLLTDMAKGQRQTLKALRQLRKENGALRSRLASMEKAVRRSSRFSTDVAEAQAQMIAPLIKGQAELKDQLAGLAVEQPMAFGMPGRPAARALKAHRAKPVNPESRVSTVPAQEKVLLYKGLTSRVITDSHIRAYQMHGRFVADDAENAALVEAVKQL